MNYEIYNKDYFDPEQALLIMFDKLFEEELTNTCMRGSNWDDKLGWIYEPYKLYYFLEKQ